MSNPIPDQFTANDGRVYSVAPALGQGGTARVRLRVASPNGRNLPTVGNSMTADKAEQYALAILAAVTMARIEARAVPVRDAG